MNFQHESLILSDVFLHLLRHYKNTPLLHFGSANIIHHLRLNCILRFGFGQILFLIVFGSDPVFKPLGRFSWKPLALLWNSAFGFCCEPFKVEDRLSCSPFWSYLKYHQMSYSAWSHLDPGFLVEKYLHRDISSFKLCSFG